jgi:hypothetical protein
MTPEAVVGPLKLQPVGLIHPATARYHSRELPKTST